MKLELKHLTPYLPYKLKVTFGAYEYAVIGVGIGQVNLLSPHGMYDTAEIENCRPLLHPLSELTEPTFFDELEQECDCDADREFIDYLCEQSYSSINAKTLESAPYHLMQKLLKWHFDVFGLIKEGLAVDAKSLNHKNPTP